LSYKFNLYKNCAFRGFSLGDFIAQHYDSLMKLIKAHITNFRSAEDSEEFRVDPVTCLVGKNEAGKSTILAALAALNPHPATPMVFDKERDYPRRFLTEYGSRHPNGEAVAITTTWELTSDEVAEVEDELGKGVLKSPEIKISRAYGAKTPSWVVPLNLPKAIESLFEQFKLGAPERAQLKAASNKVELVELLTKLESPTDKQKALLEKLKSFTSFTGRAAAILQSYLPQFMYFSNYDRMEGAVSIDHLQQLRTDNQLKEDRYRGYRLFEEFLDYAGVPLNEILKVNTYETFNAKLQAASNNITDQILEYWTQNPDLDVQVKIEPARSGDPAPLNQGQVARARIYNSLHRVDTPFSERSAGFVWFFSFLVKFAQVKDEEVPVILLLDEPGLTLHGKAQADLLRYFDEKLAPHHQIVYSTHSPFMVAPDKLLAARVVEDQVEMKGQRRVPLGTKVREDVLSRDPDTLFPLQGALGYEITQTLFIGKHTLLVEGPGDIIYLKALSSALGKAKRTQLDPRWMLCPAGGIGNVRSFMALFGGNKLDVAVLTDYAQGQKGQVEKLRSSDILKAGRVFTIDTFTGKAEADIEDLFEPALFADLLNSTYDLKGKAQATAQKLDAADTATVRLVKKAEAYFRTEVPESTANFDHYAPAEWLMLNPTFLDASRAGVPETFDRAEALFKALNALLTA
jgi:predicted ATP-dependent endonuclease of OLD family